MSRKTPLEKLAEAQFKCDIALYKLHIAISKARENEADIVMKSETKEK